MKFNYIIFLLALSGSCNKYLDKPGDSTQVIPKSLEDVEMLLDAPIRFGGVSIGTDEYVMPMSSNPSQMMLNFYLSWTPNDLQAPLQETHWQHPYSMVFSANLSLEVLNKIGRSPSNSAAFDRLKGTAHFLRAAALTTIAWQYSKAYNESSAKNDLGIVLDLNSDPMEKLQRSSIEETYRQIIEDAQMARQLLPDYSAHAVRPSGLAANGLLARIYLSMRKYDKVLENCNAYLEKQQVLLNYNDAGLTNPAPGYPMAPYRWGPEVIYSMRSIVTVPMPGSFTSSFVDTILYNNFAANDIRKKAWFQPGLGYYTYRGSYLSTQPHSSICTAEMFLMRAECYARDNQVQKAMDDLNELLKNRIETASFTPLTATSKEEALAIVLMERRKELLLRGLRWMDIKRLNEEGANISITRKLGDKTAVLPPRDPRFAMQIPRFLVETYGYKQNPIE